MFAEQVGWAAEAGVDFVIAETIDYPGEALLALEAIKAHGLDAVVTLTIHRQPIVRGGDPIGAACRRLQDAGADVVGLNCMRGPATMLPLLGEIRTACDGYIAALPVPYRTTEAEPTFQSLTDPHCDLIPDGRPFPTALDPFLANRYEMGAFTTAAAALGVNYFGICCGGAPHHVRAMAEALGRTPQASRFSADMSLARLLRHQRTDQPALPGVRQRALGTRRTTRRSGIGGLSGAPRGVADRDRPQTRAPSGREGRHGERLSGESPRLRPAGRGWCGRRPSPGFPGKQIYEPIAHLLTWYDPNLGWNFKLIRGLSR